MHCQSLSFERQFPCWENYGAPSRHPFRFSSHFRFSSPTFRICVKRQQRHPEFLQFQACGPHASFNSPLNCAASEVTLGRPQVSLNPLDRSLDNLLERPVKGEIFELKATLKGARIFLIGMMGCGKSTVGKLLAEALDYRFLDSDTMIEEASGGMTVAQIFKEHNEDTFRDFETQALMGLSNKDHLVVGTGGGIVIRPINWTYLRHGLTVYLDVPLEALAERVVAVGTASRPLLGVMVDDSAHSKVQGCVVDCSCMLHVHRQFSKAHTHLDMHKFQHVTEGMKTCSSLQYICHSCLEGPDKKVSRATALTVQRNIVLPEHWGP